MIEGDTDKMRYGIRRSEQGEDKTCTGISEL